MTDASGPGSTAPGATPLAVPAEDLEALYHEAPCGHLTMRPDGTIVRVNDTFLRWTGLRRDDLVGRRRFSDLLTAGGRIYVETHLAPLLAMQGRVREIALDVACGDGALPVLVSAVNATGADGQPLVRAAVFDATERREYERELLRARERAERSEAHARALAETLQASFIPPEPPAVPRADVGAAYRPAGSGAEVGGDFYDVFETAEDDWAVVIGDVCGKGVAAATVTALARYTLRAAAMRVRGPRAVLGLLNEALLRNEDGLLCTVLYLRLRWDEEDRPVVTVASGGHPLPVLVGDGPPREVGEPGTLLGVVDAPPLPETTVRLQPGSGLVVYTDGLVEGRRQEEFYGERRLLELLDRHAGLGASALATALVDDVVGFQDGTPRDDMAVVVLRAPG